MRMLAGGARKDEALRLIDMSPSVQAMRRVDADAEPRMLENALGGVLPQDDPGPGRIGKPRLHVPAGVIGGEIDRKDEGEGQAPKPCESADDGGSPFPRQQERDQR